MAKRNTGFRVKVFDGKGKKVLGFGCLIGYVDVWVIVINDSIKSLKNAEQKPSEALVRKSGGRLVRLGRNAKIRLDDGSIVYGCQVWWEKVWSWNQPVH